MVKGLSHITFIVRDMERMSQMLFEVLDAREIYDSGDKSFSVSREKFFLVGDAWIAIMEGEPLKEKSYNHVAFKIEDGEYEEYVKRIEKLGLEMKPPRNRVEGEGRSVYFYDAEGHLFELHTGTLEERLKRYGNEIGY